MAICEKALGPAHPDVATSLHNLASVYRDQERYAQAEQLLQPRAGNYGKSLGPDHPDVATCLNNLAEMHRVGDSMRLRHTSYTCIAIDEETLGPDHPDVATNLNNLALLYLAEKQYAKAEPLLQRCSGDFKKKAGPDHPDVAISAADLASIHSGQGQYAGQAASTNFPLK